MHDTFAVGWTRAILVKEGWESAEELFGKLRSIPEKDFTENGILVKAIYISNLRKLIVSTELDGDSVKEAKQMTSPGSLFESLNPDYLFIRHRYLQKRRKLREHLMIINKMIAGL